MPAVIQKSKAPQLDVVFLSPDPIIEILESENEQEYIKSPNLKTLEIIEPKTTTTTTSTTSTTTPTTTTTTTPTTTTTTPTTTTSTTTTTTTSTTTEYPKIETPVVENPTPVSENHHPVPDWMLDPFMRDYFKITDKQK